MSITDYTKLITVQTKEHTGNGYFPTEITTSFCDSPLCAEVHHTGIIYRNGPRFSPMHQPSTRLYDPSGFYNDVSYGHVAPCSIKITINNIEKSTETSFYQYANYTSLERDFYGFNYNVDNSSLDNNDNIDLFYTQKKWLIPMTSGAMSDIPIQYGIASLEFDRSSSFVFTNGYSRNVYMYLDLYVDSDIYNGIRSVCNTFRKNVGSVTYGVTSGNIHQEYIYNNDIDETYYNSTVNCTGWQNVSFDEVIFATGHILNENTCNITFSSYNNVLDNYNFAENISNYIRSCSGENWSNASDRRISEYYPTEYHNYMKFTHLTHPLQIPISINNVNGMASGDINGHHILTLDNVEPSTFNIDYLQYNNLKYLSKRFDHFDLPHSGIYNIVDPMSRRFNGEYVLPVNNAHITHACIFNSNANLLLPSSGDFFVGLFSVYKYNRKIIQSSVNDHVANFHMYPDYDSLSDLGSFNPYEYITNQPTSSYDNVIALYSGHYTFTDTSQGRINNAIRCQLVTTHYSKDRFLPVLNFYGSYIDILPYNSQVIHPVSRSFQTEYGSSKCVPNSAPFGVLVDCSNLLLSNGASDVINDSQSMDVYSSPVNNPVSAISYHVATCWDAGTSSNRLKADSVAFSCSRWNGSSFVSQSSTAIPLACSGCSASACHAEPDYYPNGTYFLRPGYLPYLFFINESGCLQDMCTVGESYYYQNPNIQSFCDWSYLLLTYSLTYIELRIFYGYKPGDYHLCHGADAACEGMGHSIRFRSSTNKTDQEHLLQYSGILDCNQVKTLSLYDPNLVHTSGQVAFGNYFHGGFPSDSSHLERLPCGTTLNITNGGFDIEPIIDSKYFIPSSGGTIQGAFGYQHPRYISGDVTITPVFN